MADIFISYAKADKRFVKHLYAELQRFNVRGFMDETDVAAGADLSRQLRDTIAHADAVVVVLSEDAATSRWVMTEIGLAQSFNKPVIPVLAPGSSYDRSVPDQLVDRVVVDANIQSLEITAAKIVAAVTKTSLDAALSEVQTRARRRQRILIGAAVTFALLSLILVQMSILAFRQRREAEYARKRATETQIAAERARDLAEEQRKRVEKLTGQSAALAVSPDGRIVATGSKDGSVRLWDIGTGETLSVLQGHHGTISGLAFSPDATRLATASWDGNVALWEVSSAKLLIRFHGHTDAVIGVAFGPDGRTLFSRSLDGTIRIWEIQTGQLMRIIEIPNDAP